MGKPGSTTSWPESQPELRHLRKAQAHMPHRNKKQPTNQIAISSQTLQKTKGLVCILVSGLPAFSLNAGSFVSMLPELKLGCQTKTTTGKD